MATETKFITEDTENRFNRALKEAVEEGFVVTHFSTIWRREFYVNDLGIQYSAILVKE